MDAEVRATARSARGSSSTGSAAPASWDLRLGERRVGRTSTACPASATSSCSRRARRAGSSGGRSTRSRTTCRCGSGRAGARRPRRRPRPAPSRAAAGCSAGSPSPSTALALGLAARAARGARPRRAPATPTVRVLLLHAYGMGGTVRTSFNLAEGLGGATSSCSACAPPRRAVLRVPAARGPCVDDQRARPPRRAARLLGRLPSVLVHPDDYAYPYASLRTDLALAARAARRSAAACSSPRAPAFNLLAARLARPGVVTVGQEHMNFHVAPPAAGRRPARATTAGSTRSPCSPRPTSATTRARWPARRSVERIPNAVPPHGRRHRARSTRKVVVAAGRLNTQKGFDLLIPACERVAGGAPGLAAAHLRLRPAPRRPAPA